jgi:hypothetical protein
VSLNSRRVEVTVDAESRVTVVRASTLLETAVPP